MFMRLHTSQYISQEVRRERESAVKQNEELLQHEEDTNKLLNIPFTKAELNRALKKTKTSAPDKDQS